MTQARRAWYGRRADRRRRLRHPVISVGNLTSGGSGKTPVVAAIAQLLRDRGERPAILSRGYGRRDHAEGVVVVSDGAKVLEPVGRSGDEPQLLARELSGVPVLVCADRYLAGAFAEHHFATTVSVLDDGFQHVQLERDVDLLLVSPADLDDRVLPAGRLREPLAAARFADALLVTGKVDDINGTAEALGHASAFRVVTRFGALRSVGQGAPELSRATDPPTRPRAVAFAGIARPERFFAALHSVNCDVVSEMVFRDHHWYSSSDLDRIHRAAQDSDASIAITTEKDAMRFDGTLNGTLPIVYLPMTVEIEPAAIFETWLMDRLIVRRRGGE